MKATKKIRKRNTILVSILAALVVIGIAVGLFLFWPQPKFEAKSTVELAYGDPVILEPALFVESDNDNITLESSLISDKESYTYNKTTHQVVSKGESTLAPGEYTITLRRNNQEVTSKLIIKSNDRIQFISMPKLIVVEQDAIDFDLSNYFLAIATKPIHLECPDIDISKPSEQTITIKAICEDKTALEASVNVKVITAADVANGETLSSMVNGEVPLSQTTWDALDSGTLTSISIADQPKQIQSVLLQASKGTLANEISFKEPKDKKFLNPKTFTPKAKEETKSTTPESQEETETPDPQDTTPIVQTPIYNYTQPSLPVTNPGQTEPEQPSNPGPTEPEQPSEPGTTEPEQPSEPGTTEPEQPSQPEQPSDPGQTIVPIDPTPQE